MSNYYKTPLGAVKKDLPSASIASTATSVDLVSNDALDSYYFRSLEDRGVKLNEPQIEAVRHVNGTLLVLAGAGSGKTSVLVSRTGYLITIHNVAPKNILLVTFTNKAAKEMRSRIAQLPGLSVKMAKDVQASTFHSFFLRILRHKGFNHDILSGERYKQFIIKRILKEMGLQDSYQPEALLALFSSYKVNMVLPDQIPNKTPAEKEIKQIFVTYEQWKVRYNKIDFDDVLLEAYYLLNRTPSLLKLLQQRFTYVMVDEFQDTNALQYELLKMIVGLHENISVVGDDDQTIYTFNGARNDFILDFNKQFPRAKTITLDVNYRSTTGIVGLGNEVVRRNANRKEKTLKAMKLSDIVPLFSRPPTTDDEAEIVVKQMKEDVQSGKRKYQDFAILHRAASNSRAIFEQLALEKIPFISYTLGDQLFYEQWMIKPVVDHLRLTLDPKNMNAIDGMISSLFINRERGIDFIQSQELIQAKKYPLIHLEQLPELKPFQKESIKRRIELIKSLKSKKPVASIQQIRKQFYDRFLEANEQQKPSLHKESIKETLDELEASAKRFNDIPAFLSFIDDMLEKHKEMEDFKKDPEANAVSLMTIHRAKGLEFPVVYVIGASEGILPHSSAIDVEKMDDAMPGKNKKEKMSLAIEEERRLAYVAITRAQEELYISSPAFYRGKKAEVSRFILEPFLNGEQRITKSKSSETVLAWECTSSACIAWQMITTHEDVMLEEKNCPMCGGLMEKGSKEL